MCTLVFAGNRRHEFFYQKFFPIIRIVPEKKHELPLPDPLQRVAGKAPVFIKNTTEKSNLSRSFA